VAGSAPAAATVGTPISLTVRAAPGTPVTASGAGVQRTTVANAQGVAVVRVVPRRAGVLGVNADNRPIKKFGVARRLQSGSQLAG
jgi:hypothetical protein